MKIDLVDFQHILSKLTNAKYKLSSNICTICNRFDKTSFVEFNIIFQTREQWENEQILRNKRNCFQYKEKPIHCKLIHIFHKKQIALERYE